MKIQVSLDGGLTYQEAKEGVRIIYPIVDSLIGESGEHELHINYTNEGLIHDIVNPETGENFGTSSQTIDEITDALYEN